MKRMLCMLLTAIMMMEELCDTKSTLSKLTESLKLYPQDMRNLRVKDKGAVVTDAEVLAAVAQVEIEIGGKGRVLLRQSGTEPVIRVMVEAVTGELCRAYIDRIASVIIKRGHCVE